MPKLVISKTPKVKKLEPADRWTPGIVKSGWTPIAIEFLDRYAELNITSLEAMLIIHLMRHKWDEKPPYPAFKTLAKHMGMTPQSVRNHVRSLEGKGYLKRTMRQARTNKFHLDPLFAKLQTHITEHPRKSRSTDADEDE